MHQLDYADFGTVLSLIESNLPKSHANWIGSIFVRGSDFSGL